MRERAGWHGVLHCNTQPGKLVAQDQEMVLKNTQQLLSHGGEALFVTVYDSPYFYIYKKLSKTEKWGKYMKDVKNMWPVYFFWQNIEETYREMAMETGMQVVSCEMIIKQHEYVPYLFWFL